MTIDEIKKVDNPFLTPAQIAPLCRMDPQYIRVRAREDFAEFGEIRSFPFPIFIVGTRTKIPKGDFIAWYERQTA